MLKIYDQCFICSFNYVCMIYIYTSTISYYCIEYRMIPSELVFSQLGTNCIGYLITRAPFLVLLPVTNCVVSWEDTRQDELFRLNIVCLEWSYMQIAHSKPMVGMWFSGWRFFIYRLLCMPNEWWFYFETRCRTVVFCMFQSSTESTTCRCERVEMGLFPYNQLSSRASSFCSSTPERHGWLSEDRPYSTSNQCC